MGLIRVALKLIPSWLKAHISSWKDKMFDVYVTKAYSQEGEDMILQRIFADKERGFYVDVGAHHPRRFSNTYKLYKLGWRGINIEPNPDAFNLFVKERPSDINLNIGISTEAGFLKYHMFDEPALNSFDETVVKQRLDETQYKLIGTVDVNVVPLKNILDKYLEANTQIDFMTVDVEGLDLDVLQSNEWSKYKPKWVLVEQLNQQDLEILDFDMHHFMKSKGYVLFAKTYNTLFYKNKDVRL